MDRLHFPRFQVDGATGRRHKCSTATARNQILVRDKCLSGAVVPDNEFQHGTEGTETEQFVPDVRGAVSGAAAMNSY